MTWADSLTGCGRATGQVFHDFQSVAGKPNLTTWRANYAQLLQAEVCQDLRAGSVAPPLRSLGRFALGLFSNPGKQVIGVQRFRQHDDHATAFGRHCGHRLGNADAKIGALPVQHIRQRILYVHAHQRCPVRLRLSAQQGEMQLAAQSVPVGQQSERASGGNDIALIDALDGVLGREPVSDQVFDGTDSNTVVLGEYKTSWVEKS